MTCAKLGVPCNVSADCAIASDNDSCLNMLCANSKCTSTACTGDDDCSKFGDGFTCYNGNCVSIQCNSNYPCKPGMICGPDGICTSESCSGIFSCSERGAECKKLNGGRSVCLRNPGFNWIEFIILIVLAIIVGSLAGLMWYHRDYLHRLIHG